MMTQDEEAQIREIIRAVIREEREQREADEFYISRKNLYDAHQRSMSIFRQLDKFSEVIGRTVVLCVIAGVIALIALGTGKIKL